MTKIKSNFKISHIILWVIDGLLLLTTAVLLFFSLLFSGNLAPKLFSHRVYIMDTDAFSLVKKGSAVIADTVGFDSILPGNIIIYTNDKEKAAVGEVQKSDSEGNIYTYTVKNDAGAILTVGQSHILGKGMYYSEFLGGFISFATSPIGVCCIAVLPCTAFFILEIIRMLKRKAPQPTVTTVKKQYETPTYIPPVQNKEKDSHKEDQIPLEDRIAFAEERQRLVEEAGLFNPSKKTETVKTAPAPTPARPSVSAKDIDKLIQESKAKRFGSEINSSAAKPAKSSDQASQATSQAKYSTPVNVARSAYQQAQSNYGPVSERADRPAPMRLDIDDKPLKRIDEPAPAPKPEPNKHSYARSSPRLSRLDSLLQEESGSESKYDINSILRNIDNK